MNVHFDPLVEADLPMLIEWLDRPHLLEWWRAEQSLDEAREKYLPRIAGLDAARPFIACLDGERLGYIQYYRAAEGSPDWWPDQPGPGVLGIDQFIADESKLGKGLGTQMITDFCTFLFAEKGATEIRVDPRPDNTRAIRCYEKVGFVRNEVIVTPDGPALWMTLLPDALQARIGPTGRTK